MTSNSTNFFFRELSDYEKSAYAQQGYLHIGRTLTDQGLEEMRRQCMEAWSAEKGDFDPNGTWLQNALLPDIHRRASIVREFYCEGPLLEVVSQLIGPNIKGATSQLTFKMRGNKQTFGWHQDNGYGELDPYNTISTLTALDDTDETNGCLWIAPGSHKQGQIAVAKSTTVATKEGQAEVVVEVDERRAIPLPMQAGESVLFHCWTLHKSEGNLSRERDRRLLFLRYADADAVEVYNSRRPRVGPLLRGQSQFDEVRNCETV